MKRSRNKVPTKNEASLQKIKELQREKEDLSSQCQRDIQSWKINDNLRSEENHNMAEGLKSLEQKAAFK